MVFRSLRWICLSMIEWFVWPFIFAPSLYPHPPPGLPLEGRGATFSLPFKGKVACDVCDWRVGEGMGFDGCMDTFT